MPYATGARFRTVAVELLYFHIVAAIPFSLTLSFNFSCKGNTIRPMMKYHVCGILPN
jgi:hypothetical protein